MSIHDKLKSSIEKFSQEDFDTEEKAAFSDVVDGVSSVYSQGAIPAMKSSQYLDSAKGWVYGCITVIADEVASVCMRMVKTDQEGDNPVEVNSHPALDVLYRPNNGMTRFDLMQLTLQYLELTGEAPWFISFGKNKLPEQIFLLRPDRLTVISGTKGELIGGYKYKVYKDGGGYEEITIDPLELVLLKYSDPNNPVRGKGPLQAAAKTIDLDNYAEMWNSQFFKNSATPSAVLQTEKNLSKEQRVRLEKKVNQNYRSIQNAHKTMILESGLKFEKISLSQKDMDFIEQQRFSRDKMLAIFRVPPTALGLTTDVTRANAEATDYVFAKRTIKPKLKRIEEQLNEFFIPLFGMNSDTEFIEFDDPVPENVDQDIAEANAGVTNGYMTINEARAIVDLDPIDGGDVLRDPTSLQPVMNSAGAPMTVKKPKEKPRPYYKHMVERRTKGKKRAAKVAALVEKLVNENLNPVIKDMLREKAKKNLKKKAEFKSVLQSGTFEEVKAAKYKFQEKQLKIADEYEVKLIKKLDTVFQDQKSIILRYLDNGEKKTLDLNKEVIRYQKALRPTFVDLLKTQAEHAFRLLGIQKATVFSSTKTFTQDLVNYFGDRSFKFANEVTRTTNDKLRDLFKESAEKEESIPQIKTRVSELFDGMEDYRSERIARTEVIRGSNFAAQSAWEESGVVESKEWLTTKDERTDDECMLMDGKIIPLNDNFFGKGDSFEGLKFDYESVDTPPLHVNCRCTLIPVISTPIKDGEWRPMMNEEQAKNFNKNSAFKGTLYHGTTDQAGQKISQAGFDIAAPGGTGSNVSDGVYLTSSRQSANDYALAAWGSGDSTKTRPSILSTVINVQKIKKVTDDELYSEMYGKFGAGFTPSQVQAELAKQGYDALQVTDKVIGQTYMVVFDPRNVVMTAQEAVKL